MRLSAPSQLQEFAAHGEAVNCLQLGRKSAQVLVSGGDDAKVNMWAVGKPNPILSLDGHTSAVECVSFDWNEEVVIAGSAGGQLKLWDLENSKVMRTLAGHRAGCISVDFHPFGEYFASGSLDTNLKIWDIRKKNCIVTYKGHTKGIEHVRISPDGRWVVSGSQDGMVKLWDLRAGKLMSDFRHDAAVTSMDFHPCYFQLATGCADRTVRVWDLENLQLLHHTPPEATGITSVRFVPDGSHLITTCRDYLRARTLEPEHEICDSVRVDWNHFGDLAFNSGQLVACTMSSTFVGVWLVDLINDQSDGAAVLGDESASSTAAAEAAAAVAVAASTAAAAAYSAATAVATAAGAGGDDVPSPPTIVTAPHAGAAASSSGAPGSGSSANTVARAPLSWSETDLDDSLALGRGGADSWTPAERDAGPVELRAATLDSVAPNEVPATAAGFVGQTNDEELLAAFPQSDVEASPLVSIQHAPIEVSGSVSAAVAAAGTETVGEDLDVLLRAGHGSVCAIMSARLADLQTVGSRWSQPQVDIHDALACLDTLDDDGAVVDSLSAFLRGGGGGGDNSAVSGSAGLDANGAATQLLSLDDAVVLLPVAVRLAGSPQEPHVMMGLEVAQLLLHAFATVIASSRLMQLHNARDLAAAERAEKCARCYEQLFAMRDLAAGLAQKGGHAAIKARLFNRAISTHFSAQ